MTFQNIFDFHDLIYFCSFSMLFHDCWNREFTIAPRSLVHRAVRRDDVRHAGEVTGESRDSVQRTQSTPGTAGGDARKDAGATCEEAEA